MFSLDWITAGHLGAALGMFLYSLTMVFLRDVYKDKTQLVIGTSFGVASVLTAGRAIWDWRWVSGLPAVLVGVGCFALAISTVRFIGKQKARERHGLD